MNGADNNSLTDTQNKSCEKVDLESFAKLAGFPLELIQKELFLNWDKNELADAIIPLLDQLVEQGLLSKNSQDNTFSRRPENTRESSQLVLLAKVISPILEVYYLILALIARSVDPKKESKTIAKQDLENKCYLMAQRVAMIHELNSPDYSDKKLIANFIDTLVHIDYVKMYDTEQLEYSEVFQKADKRIRLLLPKKMRANILQMIDAHKAEPVLTK